MTNNIIKKYFFTSFTNQLLPVWLQVKSLATTLFKHKKLTCYMGGCFRCWMICIITSETFLVLKFQSKRICASLFLVSSIGSLICVQCFYVCFQSCEVVLFNLLYVASTMSMKWKKNVFNLLALSNVSLKALEVIWGE